MKKALIILLAVAACTATSCIKKQHCWKCRYVFTYTDMREDIVCDKTETQIREYEKQYKGANSKMISVTCGTLR